MRRVATFLGTAAVVLMATSVYAQTPNFAGKWTVDQAKTDAANPAAAAGGGGRGGGGARGGGMAGGDITVTQDATKLVISRTVGENTITTTYNLDGSPSKNVGMGRGGGAGVETTSTAKWDGGKLHITTTVANGTQSLVISMDGDWMVQAQTNPGRDGGAGMTRTTYYKKAQ
jgi:hypothetical protein